ncbi:2-hydroxyacyl-CoA lyase 2-like [Sycon ciliatum]|uniref:2-hydroxyacyl-CoA lyase 2-like n=1 Tax=Sycon ciliatum TaxID=27933 RepID=UPI0031F68256
MDATLGSVAVALTVVLISVVFRYFEVIRRKLDDFLLKVDEKSERHGGELVGEVLKAHGVKFVYTLCGGHISPILVACEKLGIRVVDTRIEATAAFAADATARVSGTIGVCAVTAGPGLTNTVTAVKNAQMAESPLLLLGGAGASLTQGRGALQDIDQMVLFKPLCKFCARVTRVREIPRILRQAICAAQSGTPGPVFVEFPLDTLYYYSIVRREAGVSDKAKNLMQMVANKYIIHHVNSVFAGAFDKHCVDPIPVERPFATASEVNKAVALVGKAKKPVIVLGSQSTLPPTDPAALANALTSMGIPCFLGGMSRGLLGRNSPIHIRQRRRDALKEADVVILAGTVCDFRLSYGRVLSGRSKIISVNRSREQMLKNTDMFWKPALAVNADPASFLVSLYEMLGTSYHCDPEWPRELKARDQEKEDLNVKKAAKMTDKHLNPLKVLMELEEVMSEDAIMVADGGDFVGSAAYIVRPRGPLRWLDPGAFGTLGVGAGFALGVKLCNPDTDVWTIFGDGALGYSLIELDTFVRHKVPIAAVVGNDGAWTQIMREQEPMFKSNVGCQLTHNAYEQLADGFGAQGLLLDRSCNDTITLVLKSAQKAMRSGKPALVNVLIGRTDFRDGSISV